MKQSKERAAAHRKLDDYIDFLVENGSDVASTDGTDGWTLSID